MRSTQVYIDGVEVTVTSEIEGLIDSAPGTLDTLNELAAAINDDPNFFTTISNDYVDNTEMTTISGDILTVAAADVDSDISTHESGSSHDSRYYTETEITTISGDILTVAAADVDADVSTHESGSSHDSRYHTEAEITTISGDIITYVDAVDHSIYSLVDGTRAFTSTVSGVTPTENAHLVTKNYVDTEVSDVTTSGWTGDIPTVSGNITVVAGIITNYA